jgi:hypothetical protein
VTGTIPVLCMGAAAVAMTAATSLAAPENATTDELRAQVAALEARLAQLESASSRERITEQRSAEIRALVHDVLADADTRASLLGSGMTGGYDNGFVVGSADGNFTLRVNGSQQVRFVFNRQDDSPTDDHRWGFENALTRLQFSGNVVNPQWIYAIQGDFDPDGGRLVLQDAYIAHVLGGGWIAVAGQVRVPMLREWLVDETKQLAVGRSLISQEFSAGRTQGVALDYRNDWLHFTGGFTDGHPATGGFNAPAMAPDTEFALTARVETLLAGGWGQFTDFTSMPGEPFALMLGGAVHWQKSEYGFFTPAPKLEVVQWTLDASAEFGGANLFGYVVGRHFSGPFSFDQFGVVVQGGLFIVNDWEVFARYEWGDDDIAARNLSVITAGVNHYVAAHQLKWTTDVGFGLRPVSSTWGDGLIGDGGGPVGWRTDAADRERQIVIRTQFQLAF